MLHFIDFEVTKYDWLCVIINPSTRKETVIINDKKQLEEYYQAYKKEIFIGYNIRGYDQFIFKGIMSNFNPKEINDFIIVQKNSGYRFCSAMNRIPLIFYDTMPADRVSLKTLEGFMGMNIHEYHMFDIDRPLTDAELEEMVDYCRDDVKATIKVFLEREKLEGVFSSHVELIKTFKLPLQSMCKTQAQLSAEILECSSVNFNDEWEIEIINTLEINKYHYVVEWFTDKNNRDYEKNLETFISGVPHNFAWGGIHGAKEQYHSKGLLIHVDADSFYPAEMIEYGLLSRAIKNPDKYRDIRDTRLEYKKIKDPRQRPYKIVLNGTYGISKDRNSKAYDPRRANEVCINGQLLLLDLIEHLEVVEGFELIQSNTDGLIIKIPDTDTAFNAVDDICFEWENRCKMRLKFDFIKEIHQKDVNNYVYIQDNGEVERKGAYCKEKTVLDMDAAILNTALVEYFVNHVPVEKTILNCNDLLQFQKIVKVSNLYLYATHNGKQLEDKVLRVFASKNKNNGSVYKCKWKKTKAKGEHIASEKFGNVPEHAFILNTELNNNPEALKELDKDYYIKIVHKRLKDYGVDI